MRLTQQGWNELIKRLNKSAKAKQAFLMRAQHKRIADELRDLKFVPEICPRSRELAAVSAPGELAARADALMRRRKLRVDKTRQETAQAQMAHVTFKPDLKTPCVCGRGTGVVPVEAEKKDHTTFCNNFMRACAAVNANRAAAGLEAQSTGASRADTTAKYEQYKRIRARQRREILKEVEDRELTFSPQINANSVAVRSAAAHAMCGAERELGVEGGWGQLTHARRARTDGGARAGATRQGGSDEARSERVVEARRGRGRRTQARRSVGGCAAHDADAAPCPRVCDGVPSPHVRAQRRPQVCAGYHVALKKLHRGGGRARAAV